MVGEIGTTLQNIAQQKSQLSQAQQQISQPITYSEMQLRFPKGSPVTAQYQRQGQQLAQKEALAQIQDYAKGLETYQQEFEQYLKSPAGIKAYGTELNKVSEATRMETIGAGKGDSFTTQQYPVTTITYSSPYGNITEEVSGLEQARANVFKTVGDIAQKDFSTSIKDYTDAGLKFQLSEPKYESGKGMVQSVTGFIDPKTGKSVGIDESASYLQKNYPTQYSQGVSAGRIIEYGYDPSGNYKTMIPKSLTSPSLEYPKAPQAPQLGINAFFPNTPFKSSIPTIPQMTTVPQQQPGLKAFFPESPFQTQSKLPSIPTAPKIPQGMEAFFPKTPFQPYIQTIPPVYLQTRIPQYGQGAFFPETPLKLYIPTTSTSQYKQTKIPKTVMQAFYRQTPFSPFELDTFPVIPNRGLFGDFFDETVTRKVQPPPWRGTVYQGIGTDFTTPYKPTYVTMQGPAKSLFEIPNIPGKVAEARLKPVFKKIETWAGSLPQETTERVSFFKPEWKGGKPNMSSVKYLSLYTTPQEMKVPTLAKEIKDISPWVPKAARVGTDFAVYAFTPAKVLIPFTVAEGSYNIWKGKDVWEKLGGVAEVGIGGYLGYRELRSAYKILPKYGLTENELIELKNLSPISDSIRYSQLRLKALKYFSSPSSKLTTKEATAGVKRINRLFKYGQSERYLRSEKEIVNLWKSREVQTRGEVGKGIEDTIKRGVKSTTYGTKQLTKAQTELYIETLQNTGVARTRKEALKILRDSTTGELYAKTQYMNEINLYDTKTNIDVFQSNRKGIDFQIKKGKDYISKRITEGSPGKSIETILPSTSAPKTTVVKQRLPGISYKPPQPKSTFFVGVGKKTKKGSKQISWIYTMDKKGKPVFEVAEVTTIPAKGSYAKIDRFVKGRVSTKTLLKNQVPGPFKLQTTNPLRKLPTIYGKIDQSIVFKVKGKSEYYRVTEITYGVPAKQLRGPSPIGDITLRSPVNRVERTTMLDYLKLAKSKPANKNYYKEAYKNTIPTERQMILERIIPKDKGRFKIESVRREALKNVVVDRRPVTVATFKGEGRYKIEDVERVTRADISFSLKSKATTKYKNYLQQTLGINKGKAPIKQIKFTGGPKPPKSGGGFSYIQPTGRRSSPEYLKGLYVEKQTGQPVETVTKEVAKKISNDISSPLQQTTPATKLAFETTPKITNVAKQIAKQKETVEGAVKGTASFFELESPRSDVKVKTDVDVDVQVKPKTDVIITPDVAIKSKNALEPIDKMSPSLRGDYLTKMREDVKESEQLKPSLKQIQLPQLKEREQLKPRQQLKPSIALRLRSPLDPRGSGPKKPIKPKPIIPDLSWDSEGDSSLSKKKKKKGYGFEVQVKRRGKFIPISSYAYPKEEALAIGAKEVLGTARASFRILPSKKPLMVTGAEAPPLTSFRLPKKPTGVPTFIQRKELRIKSPGEIKEISSVGALTRKSKSIFGFKKMKGGRVR